MNELKVFQNSEFGELGVLTIDGKEFFPATQCAKILGYANPYDAIKKHCKRDGIAKCEGVSYTTNQHGVTSQQITDIKYISEGNLYRLIVRSKLPSAEKFEKWVFDEVLPELKRTGSYGNNVNLEEIIAKTATAVVTEVMKQIAPAMNQETIRECVEPERFGRKHSPGIIDRLEPAIKKEVEEMIISNRFSYLDVVKYLQELGIEITITSVWRYAKRMKS